MLFFFFAFFPRRKYGICGWLVSIVYSLTKFKFYNPQSREYQSAVRLLLTNSLIYSIFYISSLSLPFWNKRASLCFLVIPQWGDEDNELSGQVPFNATGLKAQEYSRLNLWFLWNINHQRCTFLCQVQLVKQTILKDIWRIVVCE